MKKLLHRALLPFTVFVTGACVLIIEIVATRILAPYFGNTIYSVSSVISVVLAALSVGYWIGGRLADRYPLKKLFFLIIAFSGVTVLCLEYMQTSLLPTLGYELPLSSGPLVMSCLLFFLPSFVLGTLSPFAIALRKHEARDRGVGTTAGEMFFFSTVGSIVGSLLAGFVLIPLFGIKGIIVGVGVVLFLLGIIPLILLGIERKISVMLAIAASSTLLLASVGLPGPRAVYSADGLYEKITILDGIHNGRPTRFLMQDTNYSAAMYLDSDDLVFDYSQYLPLYSLFVPTVDRVLVMGGGAYSLPKAYLKELPLAKVDVSEIEPSLVPLSKLYFRLHDDPRLTNYIHDGRRMLHDTSNRYDIVFSDVYHSMYAVPAHFTTKEFMELVKSRLTSDGIFMANLIGSTQARTPSFIWSEVRTMQAVFPQVYVFAVNSPFEKGGQNIVVVASTSPGRLDLNDTKWRINPNPIIANIASHYIDTSHMSLDNYAMLTDDYAPVDYMTAKVLPKR